MGSPQLGESVLEIVNPTPADIATQYRAQLPTGWTGRYGHLANADTIQTLIDGAVLGLNDKSLCEAAGVHPVTLQQWHKRAEQEPEGAHAAFLLKLKEARAKGKIATLRRISAASDKPQFWTAGAWMLERTDPEQFALRKDSSDTPKVIVQIGAGSGDVKVGIMIADAGLSPSMQPLHSESVEIVKE